MANEGYIRNCAIQGSFGCTIMLLDKGEEAIENDESKIFLAETNDMKLNMKKVEITYK